MSDDLEQRVRELAAKWREDAKWFQSGPEEWYGRDVLTLARFELLDLIGDVT